MKLQLRRKNIKKSVKIMAFIFLASPFIVYSQYYIIENIPNDGDDGLHPKVKNGTEFQENQIIEEDIVDVVTTTKTTTITKTITNIIEENKTSFHAMSLIGTISGAAIALATTAVPLFATTPTMMHDLLFLNFFGFLVKRKNEKRWGVVFDTDTKLPLPAVKIILFDEKMKELETTYSNKEGRFGFLAGGGIYNIDVYKKNYEMLINNDIDNVYGNLYTGGNITIEGDKVLSVNIALRSTTIDWKEYADKKIKQYTSTWALVKKYLFVVFYFVGFLTTIIITIFYPSIFNITLTVINIVFFIIIFFMKKKDHGTVMTNNNKPVPFAVVNLYEKKTGKKDAFAVTDVIGRYYMLADNGKYTVKATGQSVGGDKKEIQNNVNVRSGIVSEDIVL